jgi:hypothetical protein
MILNHRRNVTKSLIILLALSLVLALPGLAMAAGETVVSVATPGQVEAGEQFVVNVVVEPGAEIAGVQFDLAFDPSLVTVESVAEGSLLSQGGAATYFSSGSIDNVSGNIDGVAGAIITPGQAVSAAGTFAVITVTAGPEGGTCPFTLSGVIAGDVNGQPVEISVVDGQVTINQPPVLNAIGSQSTNEGQTLEFTITAADPDDDLLTFSASNLPDGASFDTMTGIFSWTPRYDQAGVYVVRFEVSDGDLSDFEDVTITVIQLYEDWDVNSDEAANILDMILVGQRWDETGLTGWIREDVNEDGTISVLDMIVIGQNWTG